MIEKTKVLSDPKQLAKTLALVILFVVLFWPIYAPLLERFNARESYYSHGFLIPFVCAYLVWSRRSRLRSMRPEPASIGLLLVGAGALLHVASTVLKINFTSYLAMPLILFGIVLALGGKKFAKELSFPIAFLIFMLPLPRVLIIGISFKMKLLVTQVATLILQQTGFTIQRSGSTIYFPGGNLVVGDPCSGLRSLITFLALGALFTQFTRASVARKIPLFISVIPVAFLSNLIRILFLVVVSYVYGEEAIHGLVHDVAGMMVFVLGFLGLLLVSKVLRCQFSTETT